MDLHKLFHFFYFSKKQRTELQKKYLVQIENFKLEISCLKHKSFKIIISFQEEILALKEKFDKQIQECQNLIKKLNDKLILKQEAIESLTKQVRDLSNKKMEEPKGIIKSHIKISEQPINVNIKRIDKDLPLPIYQTEGSVGFDLLVREDISIATHSFCRIPVNVIVKIPKGYMLQVSLRSSTPEKYNLIIPHGIGVIDQDYCGPQDEILLLVYNIGDKVQHIPKGTRLGQAIFVKIVKAEWHEVESIETENRSGFGSTDTESTTSS